jgi:hypothetical protein
VVYVPAGGELDYSSYVRGTWAGGKSRDFSESEFSASQVSVSSDDVDLSVPGIYTVTYRLADYGTATMYVVVEG